MKRNTEQIGKEEYDLLIIGGGIVGASAAFAASLNGLKVILIEKNDFGAATSAASGKMIHGGIRFMQHGAFLRVRESLDNRRLFLNIAPHLVEPIPFLIPTYGHGIKGKEILTIGMMIYEFLGIDKNRVKDSSKKIPHFKVLSKNEAIELEPEINKEGLTGGILFYDCQMHTPERLTLAFIQAAVKNDALVYNYLEATELIFHGNKVLGTKATDNLSSERFEIKAKFTLNASGPWFYTLLDNFIKTETKNRLQFSKGIHFVTKSITNNHAVALATKHKQAKSLLTRGGRHFFIAPWKNLSLVGTTNEKFSGHPDDSMVSREELEGFLDEISDSYKPASKIRFEDVIYYYGGLYIDDTKFESKDGYQGNRKDKIINHKIENDIENLISLIGVKYTTTPELSFETIKYIIRKLNKKLIVKNFSNSPLYGGKISNFDNFVNRAIANYESKIDKDIINHLILSYGTNFEKIINLALNQSLLLKRVIPELPYIFAEITYAIQYEMAKKLSDILLRRLGIATVYKIKRNQLTEIAEVMGEELNWSQEKKESEISDFYKVYSIG